MAEIIQEEQKQPESVQATPLPESVPMKSGNGAWFGLIIILIILGAAFIVNWADFSNS